MPNQKTFLFKYTGFTLIELLIVMVIVGILASIAYQSYRQYINQAHRSDGHSALLDLASRMERYYSENHTYQAAAIASGDATEVLSSATSSEGWYTLGITSASATSYAIQATPVGTQATYDTLCQSLTLDNLGIRGITAGPGGTPTGTAEDCW